MQPLAPEPTPISDNIARTIYRSRKRPKVFLVSRDIYAAFLNEQSRLPVGFCEGGTFHGVNIKPDV